LARISRAIAGKPPQPGTDIKSVTARHHLLQSVEAATWEGRANFPIQAQQSDTGAPAAHGWREIRTGEASREFSPHPTWSGYSFAAVDT